MKTRGRPEKNTVTYFPYFVREGTKMFCIESTYGNDGYATVIKLLAHLADSEFHYIDANKPATLMHLCAKCKVDRDKFMNIVTDAAELGKFNKTLWEESRIIWSDELIESLQEAYKKRSNDCIDFDNLLLLLNDLGIRKINLSTLDSSVNTQTKLNKTKLNINIQDINVEQEEILEGSESESEEKKPQKSVRKKAEPEKIPTWEEVWQYISVKYPNAVHRYFKAKYDAWEANGWKDLQGSPIKNWKSKFSAQSAYDGALSNNTNNGNAPTKLISL